MGERREFVVYLSSTLDDLQAERTIAMQTIAEVGQVKTSYRADEQGTVIACTQDVRGADLYVGILGQRYGYVPPAAEGNAGGKSITELEYEACVHDGQPPVPRLMFVKDTEGGIPSKYIDAISNQDTAQRIADFLARAAREQQPFLFKSQEALRAEIRIRVREQADRFHAQSRGPTTLGTDEDWPGKLVPVAIGCVPGNDEVQRSTIKDAKDARFRAFDLSGDDPDYLATLDAALNGDPSAALDGPTRGAQLCVPLVTAASLSRHLSGAGVEATAQGLKMLKRRTGRAVLLCEGVSAGQLPGAWADAEVVELAAGTLAQGAGALAVVHERLRAIEPGLTLEPRLALPTMVVAPTLQEVRELADPDGAVFAAYADPDERVLRKKQFGVLAAAALALDAGWPDTIYGPQREDWRCFGSNEPKVLELLQESIERLNDAPPGSRERRLLKSARLLPRRYGFDEVVHDTLGSRRAVLRARGACLLVVDELALLHPALRGAVESLVARSGNAVVVLTHCDPAHTSTRQLLGDLSFLRVGSLVQRFRDERDPRCELAVNSRARIDRWLAAVVPELVVAAQTGEVQRALGDRMADRLAGR